ncbi:TonB-dependent receptor [Agriterribacter sp.]|uniref:TonB-dependent receptor n=1 Tax=Agriterribacter sp. TaxID=2821509 RepID=UPI002CBD274B|nr:TonB-dependent receptor [Agriterribacter sp.]HTN08563.1 TonB-dependent receptor [Agriterribacter sp.]
MKLTVLLIFIGVCHAMANVNAQGKVTLNLKRTAINKAFNSIEKQGFYRFVFNSNLKALRQKVSISVEEAPINEVLNHILLGTQLTYQLLDDNLIVVRLQDQQYEQVKQDRTITGKVTDENDLPLLGVSVTLKGGNEGATTDAEGNYTITVPDNSTLVFSFVGYQPVEIAVGTQTIINAKLQPSASQELEQIIVVGYGTQRKIDVTGSVANIGGEEISRQASPNPISALQGKVAGVQITNSGAPGASPQIRIRGVGTVYGNANPLYVVDGIWFDDVSFLNPADIESISILKDASSEAIYGIRAANGVVLITTKKGSRNKKAVVNYNGSVGNQIVTNQIKMANGPQYAEMVNDLDKIGGAATGRYADPGSYGTTDWYHQILRNALITNHQVSVSGGGERSTYNFSLGYLLQDGIVKDNRFERYTAKFQNDFQVFNPLKVGYIVTASMNNSNDINGSIFHQIYAGVPIVPVYYADGTYGDPNDFNVTSSANFNPQVTLDFFNQKSKNYRLTGTVYADLKFAKNFTFHTNVGGEFGENEVRNYSPRYTATLVQRNSVSKLTLTDAATRNWILENTLTYDSRFGDHNLKVLVGQGAQSYRFKKMIASAENVPNNSEGDYYLSLGDNRNIEDVGDGYPSFSTVVSYFGRINYSFQNKYLLTATMRADGSSKFSGDNRWGYFPSVGVGWVISEENFMKNQTFFDNLKLRASWGKIGNMSVPANLSLLKVTQTPEFIYVGGNGATATGASINTIVPPVTYWERGVGTDVGLEASLLSNKLFAEINYYNKKTEKAIFDIPVLGSLGTSGSSIIGNQATFQNQGMEFLVTWKENKRDGLSYSLSANLGVNNNKVLDVSTGANPIYQAVGTTGSNNWNTRTIAGRPIGEFVGLDVLGVFQTAAEIQQYVSKDGVVLMPNAVPGDLKMRNVNEDGVIDDKDRVVLGNPNPKFTYGFNTSFNYRQFDLSLDFQGIAGVEIYNANIGLRFGTENFSEDFYNNRWHGEGTSNTYPSVYLAGGLNPRSNSFYVSDGSYFRIRNAQLGYTIASAITDRWKISKLRVYVDAQNALNFFSYKGFSPEVGGTPTRAGVDNDVYPLYATYRFGVNVTF